MKRLTDLVIVLAISPLIFIPALLVMIAVKLTSKGPALYWSDRVGKDNQIFQMPKFRSMKLDTPEVASHLLSDPKSALTPIGHFIRKTSLDELPQILCVLKGDMSLVGPRPALFNQDDLIESRTALGVDRLIPGVTGWAQVNGRDELELAEKVKFDKDYLDRKAFVFDIRILWLTFLKVIKSESVSH
jgi:O-antigen biosynthesis protein WbqP